MHFPGPLCMTQRFNASSTKQPVVPMRCQLAFAGDRCSFILAGDISMWRGVRSSQEIVVRLS
jgi:hypothetical protein